MAACFQLCAGLWPVSLPAGGQRESPHHPKTGAAITAPLVAAMVVMVALYTFETAAAGLLLTQAEYDHISTLQGGDMIRKTLNILICN